MNLLGQIILICLVLAALRGLIAVIVIAVIFLLLWGLFFRTEQTVGLVAFCLFITALQVPDVRVHDLRHSCASNLVNSGQSLYVVSRVLGHAQAKTSERYAHLAHDTLVAAVDAGAAVANW